MLRCYGAKRNIVYIQIYQYKKYLCHFHKEYNLKQHTFLTADDVIEILVHLLIYTLHLISFRIQGLYARCDRLELNLVWLVQPCKFLQTIDICMELVCYKC